VVDFDAVPMEQLVFDLHAAEPPSFDNFVAGANAEVIAALKQFVGAGIVALDRPRTSADALPAASPPPLLETSLFVWGADGAGKSHLLEAAVRLAKEQGAVATLVTDPGALEDADVDALAASDLVAVDDVDAASAQAQAQIFTLYNTLRARRHRLIAASRRPLAVLPLREDVRTRLGWGLVYEVSPLSDADKPDALLAYSHQRGLKLSEEVIRYLLLHGRRDMTTLVATLAALDRHSLSIKRPITVPLLREWLQRDMPLSSRG
jgi:DnaA family protein